MAITTYLSYLIRIWQSGDPSINRWHASLQEPTSQHIIYFETLEELFTFLIKNTKAEPYQIMRQTDT